MKTTVSIAAGSHSGTIPDSLWLNSKTWDLTFISLSAVLVIIPFLTYDILNQLFQIGWLREVLGIGPGDTLDVSRNIVNGLIALFIGGPHMYSTYTRTFLDGEFRRGHAWFLLGSLLIPVGVVVLGILDFELLITFFFFWASVHIMHQIAYIIDSYNHRAPKAIPLQDRILDYVVVFSSLYPLGVWRMVNDNFAIGHIRILFPDFLLIRNNPDLGWGFFVAVSAVFFVSLFLWLRKSYLEYMHGELHMPKFILMGLTIVIAFLIPSYRELDVAFQGFNTWHSFQYLGLTLYINRLREQKTGIKTPFIRSMSLEGRGWRFYLFNVACSFGAVLMISFLLYNRTSLGLGFDQCYYIVVLSFLLMHYLHDHLLFTQEEALKI